MTPILNRVLPTLAAIIVAATTVSLGMWQLRRAEEREALAAQQEATAKAPPIVLGREPLSRPESFSLHPMSASGHWLGDRTVFLDNQIHKGQVGFDVITPLRIEGSDMHLIVDRGWIAGTGNRSQLPDVTTPAGMVTVSGFARPANVRFKELGATVQEGRIWENITVDRYAAWSRLKLQPVILQQTDAVADGLIRDWPKAGSGSERNRGYALQWFAMAIVTVGLWAYYFFSGRGKSEGQE